MRLTERLSERINEARLDQLFQTMSDPTRRSVVTRLGRGPATVTELASSFDMALPSFVRHLRVLEEAELVRTEKVGRVRTCWLIPDQVGVMQDWLAGQRRMWDTRLNQLDRFAATLKANSATADGATPHKRSPEGDA